MNQLSCSAWIVLLYVLQAFRVCMLLYAVASWVPSIRGAWSDFIARIVEPVLVPVRRIVPPVGGFDVAFIVVLIGVSLLTRSLPPTYCFFQAQ